MIIGIDPGAKGAVAVINSDGSYLNHMIGTDVHEFICFLQKFPNSTPIFIEKAQVFSRNGAVGMFNYGRDYGKLLGAAYALNFPIRLIPPQTWTKTMLNSIPKHLKGKTRQIALAKALHPNLDLRASERCRKPHDGLADALLLAEYGRLLLNQHSPH